MTPTKPPLPLQDNPTAGPRTIDPSPSLVHLRNLFQQGPQELAPHANQRRRLVVAPSSTALALALDEAFVGPSGTDSPGCGTSLSSPCATLTHALALYCTPGGPPLTLRVAAGSYGAPSCGAHAPCPLSIVGDGSGNTTVDCGGADRMLTSTSSLAVAQLSIGSGLVTYALNVTSDGSVVAGGGAIAVVLTSPDGDARTVSLTNVVLYNNTVSAAADGDGTGSVFMGGGAVLVYAASANATVDVVVAACTLYDNGVSFRMGDVRTALPVGGGVAVLLGVVTPPVDDATGHDAGDDPGPPASFALTASSAAGNYLYNVDGNSPQGTPGSSWLVLLHPQPPLVPHGLPFFVRPIADVSLASGSTVSVHTFGLASSMSIDGFAGTTDAIGTETLGVVVGIPYCRL
jgi:hypothetical protein